MSISTTQKNHLNKMNRAAKDVGLGNMVSMLAASGSLTSGSVTATGATVNITTGFSSVPSMWIVQSSRSGSVGTFGLKTVAGSTTGDITVTSASGVAAIANGDIFNWIALAR